MVQTQLYWILAVRILYSDLNEIYGENMNRCLTLDEEIYINQFSQGIHSIADMNVWFDKYSLNDKKDIVYNILNLVIQSHPSDIEIREAIKILNIEKCSAAQILGNPTTCIRDTGYKICKLSEKEIRNGFDILLLILKNADTRRRTLCNGNCSHWWHKDLSDKNYIRYLHETMK